jgi:hypothetical protein
MQLFRPLLTAAAFLFAAYPCLAQSGGNFGEVGIDGDWLTVDGHRFLVVGLGYEIGCRPGRLPWQRDFRPDLLHADFKRIKAAGFNTLRTWAPMTDKELSLAAEYGLWVIQGVWYDSKGDFADPAFQQQVLQQVTEEVTRSAKHPNILFYLIGNEPHGEAVHKSGVEETIKFHRKLADTARRCDPRRPASYANCVFADFLVPEMWDLTAQNVYPYAPVTIEKTLGYRGYLQHVKRRLAPNKPLVVTEFGLSVSPKGDGRGYGGNTLSQQRDGMLALWDDVLNSGAAGGCAFMWIDGWWKSGNKDLHDENAEEWFGLLSADEDLVGQPRPVYAALQSYNRAIRTQPRDGGRYAASLPVEIWSPGAETVQARIDEGAWFKLENSGSWWRKAIDCSALGKGKRVLHTRMKQMGGEWGSKKEANILIVKELELDRKPLSVRFESLPQRWQAGKPLSVTVVVNDDEGTPLVGRRVSISRFVHTGWSEFETSALTDSRGQVIVKVPTHYQSGIISIAASAEGDQSDRNSTGWKQGSRKRYGAYRHVVLTN